MRVNPHTCLILSRYYGSVSTEATGNKRGPYASTVRRRETISSAAMDIVVTLGHEAMTTALIAERSGIAEATVLYHFPTRDHLLVAALERADDETNIEAGRASFDLDRLRNSDGLVNGSMNLSRLLTVLRGHSSSPEHPAHAYFQRRNTKAIGIYTDLIARRQQDGLAHPSIDPASVALQLLALWDGLTVLHLANPELPIGDLLVDGYRRLAGENWMHAQRAMFDAFGD